MNFQFKGWERLDELQVEKMDNEIPKLDTINNPKTARRKILEIRFVLVGAL